MVVPADSLYELRRQQNMMENERQLVALGLHPDISQFQTIRRKCTCGWQAINVGGGRQHCFLVYKYQCRSCGNKFKSRRFCLRWIILLVKFSIRISNIVFYKYRMPKVLAAIQVLDTNGVNEPSIRKQIAMTAELCKA